jgi:hypothetical protein
MDTIQSKAPEKGNFDRAISIHDSRQRISANLGDFCRFEVWNARAKTLRDKANIGKEAKTFRIAVPQAQG